MSDEPRRDARMTGSIRPPGGPPVQSFASRADAEALAGGRLSIDAEPGEFVLVVAHNQTGRVFSPFLVRAKDEEAARKLCRRNFLEIRSVEPFVESGGEGRPRTLPYGPPISDTDFEDDYGNRAADPGPANPVTLSWYGLLGGLLCGPVGAVVGLLLHQSIEEPRRRG